MKLFQRDMRILVIALCPFFFVVGCSENDRTVRRAALDTSETSQEMVASTDSLLENKETEVGDSVEQGLSSNAERWTVPHSDPSDAIRYPLTDKRDTLQIGKNTIIVRAMDTPADSVVRIPAYTKPDTIYQYYRGVNTEVEVSVNEDTVLTQHYTIEDVLDAHGGNPEHSEVYVLTGIEISVESDSTRVAIRPSANIPDTDARLLGQKQYVYPVVDSSQQEGRDSID